VTPPLPAGYSARRPTPDDADAITALVNQCSMHDIGLPVVSVEQVRALWQLPGRDPAQNDWLISDEDEALVGGGMVFTIEPYTSIQGLGVVHPRHEGRGLGTWLLGRIEERSADYVALAPADEAVTLQLQSWSGNDRAAALLEAHGYHVVRMFLLMQIDFDADVPLPEAPEPDGITVRTFVRGQDERRAWQADEESFADHWNHHELPFETWRQLLIESKEDFDPTLWWLAMDGDEVAGIAICDPSAPGQPEYGWVATLGVRRPWRGRGIARSLLATAFAEYRRRSKRGVSLGVDAESPTGANRLYERVGMRPVTNTVVYAKELRAAAGK
jgi:mycothiol synthase